jgi:hypothetical protein
MAMTAQLYYVMASAERDPAGQVPHTTAMQHASTTWSFGEPKCETVKEFISLGRVLPAIGS